MPLAVRDIPVHFGRSCCSPHLVEAGGKAPQSLTWSQSRMINRAKASNIDEYIALFSPEVQTVLEKIRTTIKKAAPDAEERISYQIPAFALGGSVFIFF